MKISEHPLWLVGFRPLFTLAFLSGAVLPFTWVLVYLGYLPLAQTGLQPSQWHAHEMLYGFGWAVLGGFLLTASKNWVKIRGLHGKGLIAMTLFWIVERIAILTLNAESPTWLRFLLLNIFLISVTAYVVGTLIFYRKNDTFRDNFFFMLALPVFLVAKNLMLSPEHFAAGVSLSIGLFRLPFVVMFERTMTQFMKNARGVTLFRNPVLDYAIKFLVLVSALESFLPTAIAGGILAIAGSLLLLRWFLWSPQQGLKDFGNGIMYAGSFGLVLHFFFEAARVTGIYAGVGTLSVHVFTFLVMGLIIPPMLIRISQGHTGRKLLFTVSDRIGISCLAIGAFFRLVATQVWPAQYSLWISLAGVGWSLCFLILGWRLIPFLWQARVDGKIH